jgi:hypothetical protein
MASAYVGEKVKRSTENLKFDVTVIYSGGTLIGQFARTMNSAVFGTSVRLYGIY